jgi:hypothetical protein
VNVIGLQAIGPDLHPPRGAALGQQRPVACIVRLVEDRPLTPVAPWRHMWGKPLNHPSRQSRHGDERELEEALRELSIVSPEFRGLSLVAFGAGHAGGRTREMVSAVVARPSGRSSFICRCAPSRESQRPQGLLTTAAATTQAYLRRNESRSGCAAIRPIT